MEKWIGIGVVCCVSLVACSASVGEPDSKSRLQLTAFDVDALSEVEMAWALQAALKVMFDFQDYSVLQHTLPEHIAPENTVPEHAGSENPGPENDGEGEEEPDGWAMLEPGEAVLEALGAKLSELGVLPANYSDWGLEVRWSSGSYEEFNGKVRLQPTLGAPVAVSYPFFALPDPLASQEGLPILWEVNVDAASKLQRVFSEATGLEDPTAVGSPLVASTSDPSCSLDRTFLVARLSAHFEAQGGCGRRLVGPSLNRQVRVSLDVQEDEFFKFSCASYITKDEAGNKSPVVELDLVWGSEQYQVASFAGPDWLECNPVRVADRY